MCNSVDAEEVTEYSSANPEKQDEDSNVNPIGNPKKKVEDASVNTEELGSNSIFYKVNNDTSSYFATF